MGLLRISVAEIYCPADGKVGSGYFCTSRLVLTARHVIAGALSNAGAPKTPPVEQTEDFLQTISEKHMVCRVRTLDAGQGASFLNAVPVWWSAKAYVALSALIPPFSNRGSEVSPITWARVLES